MRCGQPPSPARGIQRRLQLRVPLGHCIGWQTLAQQRRTALKKGFEKRQPAHVQEVAVGDGHAGVCLAQPFQMRQRVRPMAGAGERGEEAGTCGGGRGGPLLRVEIVEDQQPLLALRDLVAHHRGGCQLQCVVCAGLQLVQRQPVRVGFAIAVQRAQRQRAQALRVGTKVELRLRSVVGADMVAALKRAQRRLQCGVDLGPRLRGVCGSDRRCRRCCARRVCRSALASKQTVPQAHRFFLPCARGEWKRHHAGGAPVMRRTGAATRAQRGRVAGPAPSLEPLA